MSLPDAATGKPDINVGICRDTAGRLRVGLEVAGPRGATSVCLTSLGADRLAASLYTAARRLDEMLVNEAEQR